MISPNISPFVGVILYFHRESEFHAFDTLSLLAWLRIAGRFGVRQEVAVSGADAEGERGEVGKMIFFGDAADERARLSGLLIRSPKKPWRTVPAGILRLESVLEVECFEDVVGKADGDVGGIGVVGFGV